jgi:hypothetical protein
MAGKQVSANLRSAFVSFQQLVLLPSSLNPQGMRTVTTGLGSLFAQDEEDPGADPLVYVKPKDPAVAAAAVTKPTAKVR